MSEAQSAPLSIEVNGVHVTGEITRRSPRFIVVRLVEPFGKLTESCTIPLFAAQFISFDGDHGVQTARSLLASAYRRAVLFDQHAERLRASWRSTQQMLLELERDDANAPSRIADERRAIRARLRMGEITDRQYQKLLRVLRDRAKAYATQRSVVLQFFEASRPWNESVSLREVVQFLGEDDCGVRYCRSEAGHE